jgi:hypothetical protein
VKAAFWKLELVACATVYAVGLAFVWRYMGWPTALAVAGAGILLALACTIEAQPSKPKSGPAEREGLSRRTIVARSEGRDP